MTMKSIIRQQKKKNELSNRLLLNSEVEIITCASKLNISVEKKIGYDEVCFNNRSYHSINIFNLIHVSLRRIFFIFNIYY